MGIEDETRGAVAEMIACPTRPSGRYTNIRQRPYNPDVGDIAYRGGRHSERRFFADPGRAFTFWWFANSGRLERFIFEQRNISGEKQEVISELIREFQEHAQEMI